MKKYLKPIILLFIAKMGFSQQCLTPTGLLTTNITMYSSTVSWTIVSGAHHYRIKYKDLSSTNWINFNNITSTSRNLPALQPSTTYIWQAMTYCDSSGSITSQWSILDTFTTITPQCPTPTGLFTTNISPVSATANWIGVSGVDHYRIRCKELGVGNWSGGLLDIDSTMTSRLLPLLQPLTTYEWKIESYCDSTNQLNSIWSLTDTFTTSALDPFNPILLYGMNTTLCNTPVLFTLRLMQSAYQADIASSEITSDGGYFDISSLSFGDIVGSAELTTTTDTFYANLVVFLAGSNSAIINSVDTSGSVLGFFTIENQSGGGVKITTSAPSGNNNYTSGYNSVLLFDSVFITPSSPGILRFYANIESKLNDQFSDVDSSTLIFCNTEISENSRQEKTISQIVNLLGSKSPVLKNTVLIYFYNDGTVEKKLFLE